jgi:hypothetical protein
MCNKEIPAVLHVMREESQAYAEFITLFATEYGLQ